MSRSSGRDAPAAYEGLDDLAQHEEDGELITFYSYKGGTGRSMLAANLAVYLSLQIDADPSAPRPRVLVIDFDLEAPGLDHYLFDRSALTSVRSTPGLVDYLTRFQEWLRGAARSESTGTRIDLGVLDDEVPLSEFLTATRDDVTILHAGNRHHPEGAVDAWGRYEKRVYELDWDLLFDPRFDFWRHFRGHLRSTFDYIIIDSRTGFNDISGICTSVLPDRLVGIFTLNDQSMSGLAQAFDRALSFRRHSDNPRPLQVFPIASRVETNALNAMREEWNARTVGTFNPVYARHLHTRADLTPWFEDILVPHFVDLAYGEPIVVERSPAAYSPSEAVRRVCRAVTHLDSPLDLIRTSQPGTPHHLPPSPSAVARMRPQTRLQATAIGFDVADFSSRPGEFQMELMDALHEVCLRSEELRSYKHGTDYDIVTEGDGLLILFTDRIPDSTRRALVFAEGVREEALRHRGRAGAIHLRIGLHRVTYWRTHHITGDNGRIELLAGSGLGLARRVIRMGDTDQIFATEAVVKHFTELHGLDHSSKAFCPPPPARPWVLSYTARHRLRIRRWQPGSTSSTPPQLARRIDAVIERIRDRLGEALEYCAHAVKQAAPDGALPDLQQLRATLWFKRVEDDQPYLITRRGLRTRRDGQEARKSTTRYSADPVRPGGPVGMAFVHGETYLWLDLNPQDAEGHARRWEAANVASQTVQGFTRSAASIITAPVYFGGDDAEPAAVVCIDALDPLIAYRAPLIETLGDLEAFVFPEIAALALLLRQD